jgi:hyperosmotically inducible protein
MHIRKIDILCLYLLCSLVLSPMAQAQSKKDIASIHARLTEEIRHELIMLSNYSVFDILSFEITDLDTVILSGQVTQPILKSDAENAIRRLEGVGKIVNKIEVLPLSSNDDRIRLAVYRSIFSKTRLDQYVLRAVPPIHIIVKNGNVTLVGNVASQMDKDIAGIAAHEVSGIFSVTNNLKVESP